MNIKNFIIPLVLFLIGIAFYLIAALLKILHWGLGHFNSATLLIIASGFQLLAIILAIIKLIKNYKG